MTDSQEPRDFYHSISLCIHAVEHFHGFFPGVSGLGGDEVHKLNHVDGVLLVREGEGEGHNTLPAETNKATHLFTVH